MLRIRITDIIEQVLKNYPNADVSVIDKAYIFSAVAHSGQSRLSGEPYLSHPLAVAKTIANLKLDVESVAAALLHDVIEDTSITREEIEKEFGKNIEYIVSGVTKVSKSALKSPKMANVESMRRMFLAMANDIRVILIKLADRLHNMETLHYHTSDLKKKLIAQETLDIYAPIASRLGMFDIKVQLEKLSFQHLNPKEYCDIQQMVDRDRNSKKKNLETIKSVLEAKLKENNIEAFIKGRYKQIYSIYKKKRAQNLKYEEICDIVAVRIITKTVKDCHKVYAVLHNNWEHLKHRVRDYITKPKPNMYRSLHTTILYEGEKLEVQIRTKRMDEVAESGIAAHWSYKEGRNIDANVSQKFEWLQNIIENQQEFPSSDPDDFIDNIKLELFPYEVHIYTPNGDFKVLPKGATPVDFAYSIHSDIGNSCYSAKVNGKIVPLNYQLKNDDVVEIITSKNHNPGNNWLDFVKTPKAKAKIRQWIRATNRRDSIELGKEMLEKSFASEKLNFSDFLKSKAKTKKMLDCFNYTDIDELFINIAYGKNTPNQLIRHIVPKKKRIASSKASTKTKKTVSSIVVSGFDNDNVLFRKAKCCNPSLNDKIIGYISKGAGIIIHKSNCENVQDLDSLRLIDVEWSREEKQNKDILIQINSYEKAGLISEIKNIINRNNINLKNIKSVSAPDKSVISTVTLSACDDREVTKVLIDIRKSNAVISVKRL